MAVLPDDISGLRSIFYFEFLVANEAFEIANFSSFKSGKLMVVRLKGDES